MRTTVFIFLLLASSRTLFADESLFREANQLYQLGRYSEAASMYEEVLKKNRAPELYYNLGNAYFKDQKLGSAIVNYERALRLAPRDRDIRANLKYANRLIEYKIEDKRNWSIRLMDMLLGYVSLEELWFVTLAAYFIFIAGGVLSLLVKKSLALGKLGTAALSFAVICGVVTLLVQTNFGEGRPAIMTDGTAEVRYGPAISDRLAFRLVEGLRVAVRDIKPGWYRIELRDGQTGWVPQSNVTLV